MFPLVELKSTRSLLNLVIIHLQRAFPSPSDGYCGLLFSDEDDDSRDGTTEEVATTALLNTGGILFDIGYNHYASVANATGGISFDLDLFVANASGVIEEILTSCITALDASHCTDYPCGSLRTNKVNVCHKSETTLCIAKSAAPAHLAQDSSYCGRCV